MIKQLLDAWPSDVKVVFKHYPLQFHQRARPAGLAAVAAEKQGKFWEMKEILYQNQRSLDDASLRTYAEQAGLDLAKYDKDIADPETARVVDKDVQDGNKAGVRGTPTFFVNGVQAPAWDFVTMKVLIDEAVRGGDVGVAAGRVRAERTARMQANRPPPPDPNKVHEIDVAGAPYRGPAGAKVTIVAFSDYQ